MTTCLLSYGSAARMLNQFNKISSQSNFPSPETANRATKKLTHRLDRDEVSNA
jgi:hypothetical protein